MLDAVTLAKVRETLFAGRYNLLLGAGCTIDSRDRQGYPLMGGEKLRLHLCRLKGVKETTPLSKVSQLLTESETKTQLTDRYLGCKPGSTVNALPNFVWKHIFTFNIDDALEGAYQAAPQRKQNVVPINYDSLYETFSSRYELPLIHLHGFVRNSEKGYVFSLAQYANVTRGLNPWMHVLSELLGSESFIIAGTSLTEPDLEFYLSGRTPTTPRSDRGPSILVEPHPDAVTESDCRRHGLLLVKSTLHEFLLWLEKELGSAPSLDQLTVPTVEKLFPRRPDKLRLINFFSSFHLVQEVRPLSKGESSISSFYYGRPPTWEDLASSADIPLDNELRIENKVRAYLDGQHDHSPLLLFADPGAGKTTSLKRVAYDLAREGRVVFWLKLHASIDTDNAIECLSCIGYPFVICVDSAADHVHTIRALLESEKITEPFLIIGAERSYRRDHIDRVLGDTQIEYLDLPAWVDENFQELVERYRRNGLLGSELAIKDQRQFAQRLKGEPVAVAVCRILNDFRPIEAIVKSIWNHADDKARRTYLIAALAHYCHPVGVYFPILQSSQENENLETQVAKAHPLPLCLAPDSDDYVLPLNPIVADRVLSLIAREKKPILLEAFTKLANALAPYVNRRTIIDQTPEARLAGRLFDSDKVSRPLLGDFAEKFYVGVKDRWEWNSRYWEQRALLIHQEDIATAIQYARHAVAIEQHPFPWTTLAGLLIKKMDVEPSSRDALFAEAYDLFAKSIKFDVDRSRRLTPHAFLGVFQGATKVLSMGGTLGRRQRQEIEEWLSDAKFRFVRDRKVMAACDALESKLAD